MKYENKALSSDDREISFLFSSLKAGFSEESASHLRNIALYSSRKFSWERLCKLGEEFDVAPFIYNALLASGLDEVVPPAFFSKLEIEYYQNLSKNMRALKICNQLASAFRNDGIRVILLGGGGFLGTLYENMGLRYVGDIDILIHKDRFEDARKTLGSLGFTQFKKYRGVMKSGSITIDIHTDIIDSERISSRKNIYSFNPELFWSDCIPHPEVDGAFVLSPSDSLLYSAFHCFKHSFSRIIWSIDTAEIIRKYGDKEFYDYILSISQANATSVPIYYSLAYIHETGISTIDTVALKKLKENFRENKIAKRIFQMAVDGRNIGSFSELLVILSRGQSGRSGQSSNACLKFFIESLFPCKNTLKEIYPRWPEKFILFAYLARFVDISIRTFFMCLRFFKLTPGRMTGKS
ncbi:MAG: nucleotidyltransferase family protein [Candidatus Schekmanbacteria bacterium]|nr:nucleotidyltransferase family protein [Candidatus Schekmanbacteria bacterium]